MRRRHHHPDIACNVQYSRTELYGQPAWDNLSRIIGAAEAAVRRGLGKISRERLRRARIRELMSLSDHQLLDIGVERSDIATTVEKILEQKTRPG